MIYQLIKMISYRKWKYLIQKTVSIRSSKICNEEKWGRRGDWWGGVITKLSMTRRNKTWSFSSFFSSSVFLFLPTSSCSSHLLLAAHWSGWRKGFAICSIPSCGQIVTMFVPLHTTSPSGLVFCPDFSVSSVSVTNYN